MVTSQAVPTLHLQYSSTGFPSHFGPDLHGQHRLQFGWADLMRAALLVGRPGWAHVFRHGTHSRHEASYKRYLIRANLCETPTGELIRSGVYEWLDPSEKASVSYFLGLSVASLLSERLLGKYWMVHLDVYRHLLPPVSITGRRRPDLISLDASSQYVVMECKGRTNSPEQGLAVNAKQQATAVTSIGGHIPVAHVTSVSQFGMGALSAILHDPSREKEEPIEIPVKPEEVIQDHYRPMLSFLSATDQAERVRANGFDYTIAAFPDTSDFIGVASELLRSTSIAKTANELSQAIEPYSDESQSIGRDGTYLRLGPSWSSQDMIREPQDRSA